jgi:hypothetical protein
LPFIHFRAISSQKSNVREGTGMGFKRIDRNLGFADLAVASSMEKNRSLSTLKQLDGL